MQIIRDENGKISHARVIALMVGLSATVFVWKLTIMGQLTETYMLYYLAYGVIHQNLNKSLDVLGVWLGRNETKSPSS